MILVGVLVVKLALRLPVLGVKMLPASVVRLERLRAHLVALEILHVLLLLHVVHLHEGLHGDLAHGISLNGLSAGLYLIRLACGLFEVKFGGVLV